MTYALLLEPEVRTYVRSCVSSYDIKFQLALYVIRTYVTSYASPYEKVLQKNLQKKAGIPAENSTAFIGR